MGKLTFMVWVFAFASIARAAEPASEEAKGHVREATAAYNLGNYIEAAGHYEAAYRQTLDANLLFNIGQAYRLAGERDKAITAYRSFIRSAPRSDQRGLAESKIRELEQQRDIRAPAAAPSSPAPVAPATPPVAPPTPQPSTAETSRSPLLPGGQTNPQPGSPTGRGSAESPAPGPAFDLSVPPPPATSPPTPFYKGWLFWTSVGAVAAGAVVVGVLLSRGGSDLNMGNPTFGTKDY